MAKVLFIDDESVYYRMIQNAFKEHGHELRYAKNGVDGLTEVPLFIPDVIITDVRLPDISGYEIAERLRWDPRFSRIPLIFVTGQSDLKDKLKAFELGADDYLVKPFQPEELLARMSILLRRTESLRGANAQLPDHRQTSTIVAVHSLKGGVGCSTMAVNLAVAFRQLWVKPTLLIDGVLVAGQTALMLNSTPQVNWADFAGLKAEYIDKDVTSKLEQSHHSGIHYVASPGTPIAADSFSDDFWPAIMDSFNQVNDFIVIDAAHDFSNMTIHMLDSASQIILVIAPEMASLRSAVCALEIYARLGFIPERVFVVVNQNFDGNGVRQSQIEKVIRRPVDMMIPYVPYDFVRAINFGEPYILKNPDSPITGLYEDAAFWLSNDFHKNIPPLAPTPSWKRVNSRLQTRKP
jgi:pilus assembly protein CpaE